MSALTAQSAEEAAAAEAKRATEEHDRLHAEQMDALATLDEITPTGPRRRRPAGGAVVRGR